MALLTVAELRALVETDRTDTELSAIIAREEAELTRRFGAPGDGATAASETLRGGGVDLFLPRRFASITSIQERPSIASGLQTVGDDRYVTWPAQGRLTRLSGLWGDQVVVTYVPSDERDRYRQVIIDLVRLTINRTAFRSEAVAGEHSYQAPDWQAERNSILARLRFTTV